MRKLVIDCGNTLIKSGVFQGDELLFTLTSTYDDEKGLQKFLEGDHFDAAFMASVVNLDAQLKRKFTKAADKFFVLTPATTLPFTTSYNTPGTLGMDRLALVAGAVFSFPQKNCLIINFGSCVTYNYVTAGTEFLGGAISPGLHMRLMAMNKFTAKLPLVQPAADNPVIGTTTEQNLQSGALHGLAFEVQGFIEYYKEVSPGIKIIISGGDCNLISGKLKNSGIFADANLALKGLNLILEHNVEK